MNKPSDVLPLPEIYFDHQRGKFCTLDKRGNWIFFNTGDVERKLKDMGYSDKTGGPENSEVAQCIFDVQNEQNIAYAGPLAGYSKGIYEVQGNRILVTTSPKFIEPKKGDYPTLQAMLDGLLVDAAIDQRPYIYGWLKMAIETLYAGQQRPGQALVLAGERQCGKSLLQNLITVMLGGRAAKPYQFMTGGTTFNADLFEAEHLMIEDEAASTDIRARRAFGATIKQITATEVQRCHGKNRQALSLVPFWRITISVNNEPENLMVLPPLDESIEDKMILIKAMKKPMPMATVTGAERKDFWNTLIGELPAFIDFLQGYQIPDELRDERFGIKYYHHPELVQAINSLSPEAKLLSLIDSECFKNPHGGIRPWNGTAERLERELTHQDCAAAREAAKLLSYNTACGVYLARLKKIFPERFTQGRDHNARIWTIQPPEHLRNNPPA